ncbi:MAG: hypothetical protein R3B72_36090 [Polyangiaceae bacterium]
MKMRMETEHDDAERAIRELRDAAEPAARALPAIGRALLGVVASVVGARGGAGDPRGELVALNQGWGVVPPSTLKRWAREGRLPAFALERGKLVAWERDVRRAVEVERYRPPSPLVVTHDAADALLSDPDVEVAE